METMVSGGNLELLEHSIVCVLGVVRSTPPVVWRLAQGKSVLPKGSALSGVHHSLLVPGVLVALLKPLVCTDDCTRVSVTLFEERNCFWWPGIVECRYVKSLQKRSGPCAVVSLLWPARSFALL